MECVDVKGSPKGAVYWERFYFGVCRANHCADLKMA